MRNREESVYELINAAVTNPAKAREMLAADPSLKDYRCLFNETALHFCVVENLPEAVKVLAELGSDVNATNSSGDTPLMDAVFMKNEFMTTLLLSLGANPNVPSECHESPLTCAAELGNEVMVRLLLQYRADPNYATCAFFNPLSRALDQGHDAIVRALMNAGADPELLLKDSRPELREQLVRIMEVQ